MKNTLILWPIALEAHFQCDQMARYGRRPPLYAMDYGVRKKWLRRLAKAKGFNLFARDFGIEPNQLEV